MGYFTGRTAVITGAGSGFGLEASRIAAREGMNVVMADVMPEPLAKAAAEIEALGAQDNSFRKNQVRRVGTQVDDIFPGGLGIGPSLVPHCPFDRK